MSTITIELPKPLCERLRREQVSPEQIITRALEKWFEGREPVIGAVQTLDAVRLEHERIRAAVAESELTLKIDWSEWADLFASEPELPAAEVRRMMAGVSPLSADIIAERDEAR